MRLLDPPFWAGFHTTGRREWAYQARVAVDVLWGEMGQRWRWGGNIQSWLQLVVITCFLSPSTRTQNITNRKWHQVKISKSNFQFSEGFCMPEYFNPETFGYNFLKGKNQRPEWTWSVCFNISKFPSERMFCGNSPKGSKNSELNPIKSQSIKGRMRPRANSVALQPAGHPLTSESKGQNLKLISIFT